MVIAFGSYPKGRRFESHRRYQLTILIWSHGQVVKTLPFHGGDRGSNPLGTTIQRYSKIIVVSIKTVISVAVFSFSIEISINAIKYRGERDFKCELKNHKRSKSRIFIFKTLTFQGLEYSRFRNH